MTEIRPLRGTGEAEEFLQLLCDVFELDFDRAHGIFFNEPMFDLRRKWALFEGPEIVSILTTVPLTFGWGRAIGIAGVATRLDRQREGHAGRLLERVLQESEKAGEGPTLLFARETSLYERVGFKTIDQMVRAPIVAEVDEEMREMLSFDEIQGCYDAWASAHPDRLRRDERRWKFWKWNLRVCTPLPGGYVCHEGKTIRECVMNRPPEKWLLPAGSEWIGTTFMAEQLQIPLTDPELEFHFMAYRLDRMPQLFMTDQF